MDHKTFAVGDECTYGFNGDYYPVKVTRVGKSFVECVKLVCVRSADCELHPAGQRFTRDVPGVSFELRGEEELVRFTRKGDGRFSLPGTKGGWYLSHGAMSAFNPSF